jgi:hypothetical protein
LPHHHNFLPVSWYFSIYWVSVTVVGRFIPAFPVPAGLVTQILANGSQSSFMDGDFNGECALPVCPYQSANGKAIKSGLYIAAGFGAK